MGVMGIVSRVPPLWSFGEPILVIYRGKIIFFVVVAIITGFSYSTEQALPVREG